MKAKLLKVSPGDGGGEAVRIAAQTLTMGGLLILPTETVYGLACDASNLAAIERIYQVKGRSFDKPLAVAVSHFEQVKGLVQEIPKDALPIIERFWPGPLTLIFKKGAQVSDLVTRGSKGIGIRFSNHRILTEIIEAFGSPIALTSANLSGKPSPVSLDQTEGIIEHVEVAVDTGEAQVGIESTVLDLTQKPFVILREGAVSAAELKAFTT